MGVTGASRKLRLSPIEERSSEQIARASYRPKLLLLFFAFFLQHSRRRHRVIIIKPQQPDALRRAPGFANFIRVHTNDFAVVRNDHDVGFFGDLQRADHRCRCDPSSSC